MPIAVRKKRRAAPGGIHMKMDAMLPADLGHLLKGIDRAGFSRPRNADNSENTGFFGARFDLVDLLPKGMDIELVVCVRIDRDNIFIADAEDAGGFSEGVMPEPGGQNNRAVNTVGLISRCHTIDFNAVKPLFRGKSGVPCHPEGR